MKGTAMSDNETYAETVARLRQQSYERQVSDLTYQADELNREINDLYEQAVEADQNGEGDTVHFLMTEAREKEQHLVNVQQQLPQPPQYSERKLRWAQRRRELTSHPQFLQTADAWHNYITGPMGVQDDSDDYERLMSTALEPQGYEPIPTPDELIKTINETSKYCRKDPLTAKQFNRYVEPAHRRVAEQLTAQGKKF
jgi:hypothetical protein